MRLINWFINRYATPALILGGILSGIFAVILSISLLFNLNPYVKIGKSNFGFTNYDQCIPVKVSFPNPVIDTNIRFQTSQGGSGRIYKRNDSHYPSDQFANSPNEKIISSDTIIADYAIVCKQDENIKAFSVKTFSFSEGVCYVETKSYAYKLLFILPKILLLIIVGFCFYQSGMLIHYIQNDGIFEMINFKRLQNIGIAIIGLQLFYFLHWVIIYVTGNYWYFTVDFSSTIPNFRSPIQIQASPDYGFDWYWFSFGCILFAIAKAFQKGYTLQQEQDLTV